MKIARRLAIVPLLLAGCLQAADPADYPLVAHVSAVGQRRVPNGETPITNTYTGQIVDMSPDYRRITYMAVLIGGRKYLVEGKPPLEIGDYPARFTSRHHRRSVELLLPGGKVHGYTITEESRIPTLGVLRESGAYCTCRTK